MSATANEIKRMKNKLRELDRPGYTTGVVDSLDVPNNIAYVNMKNSGVIHPVEYISGILPDVGDTVLMFMNGRVPVPIESAVLGTALGSSNAKLDLAVLTLGTVMNASHAGGDNLEKTTAQISIAAGLFSLDGGKIQGYACGRFAANTDHKRLRIYFGGTVVADTGDGIWNSGTWRIEFKGWRTASNSTRWYSEFKVFDGTPTETVIVPTFTTVTFTLSGSTTIDLTTQVGTGTSTTGDMVVEALTAQYAPS